MGRIKKSNCSAKYAKEQRATIPLNGKYQNLIQDMLVIKCLDD